MRQPLYIDVTGEDIAEGRLSALLAAMPLDREYDRITTTYPDGTSSTKTRRNSTPSRTARNAMASYVNGSRKNEERRAEIVRQGSARIAIHFLD